MNQILTNIYIHNQVFQNVQRKNQSPIQKICKHLFQHRYDDNITLSPQRFGLIYFPILVLVKYRGK